MGFAESLAVAIVAALLGYFLGGIRERKRQDHERQLAEQERQHSVSREDRARVAQTVIAPMRLALERDYPLLDYPETVGDWAEPWHRDLSVDILTAAVLESDPEIQTALQDCIRLGNEVLVSWLRPRHPSLGLASGKEIEEETGRRLSEVYERLCEKVDQLATLNDSRYDRLGQDQSK